MTRSDDVVAGPAKKKHKTAGILAKRSYVRKPNTLPVSTQSKSSVAPTISSPHVAVHSPSSSSPASTSSPSSLKSKSKSLSRAAPLTSSPLSKSAHDGGKNGENIPCAPVVLLLRRRGSSLHCQAMMDWMPQTTCPFQAGKGEGATLSMHRNNSLQPGIKELISLCHPRNMFVCLLACVCVCLS
jgi:hypothetical protein